MMEQIQNTVEVTKTKIEALPSKIMKTKSGSPSGQESTEGAREYNENERTTFLIIAWCFSMHGDVCNALRSDSELSRLILESDMRQIGISNAKLNFEQIDFLKKATDLSNKDHILFGKILF